MQSYFRPIAQQDACRPDHAVSLAGGAVWFEYVEILQRGVAPRRVPLADIPAENLANLTAKRPAICGLDQSRPIIMGVINATPDSFSDGGRHHALRDAVAGAEAMMQAGADVLDIGGESTRPGAEYVPVSEEIRRVVPVITALREAGVTTPISVDTRKAEVARAAVAAGANLFNDVSALSFDPESIATAAELAVPTCLMHAAGDPKTMQNNPHYDDVLLDIYDYLSTRIAAATNAGIAPHSIIIDPGIGFGKTVAHNLALMRGLSLFHGLGCPILLGTSRKRFIGALSNDAAADQRLPGSLATALEGLRQGVQWLRVHDVAETHQAVALWRALLPSEEMV
jgi:dihydropteroate synthase